MASFQILELVDIFSDLNEKQLEQIFKLCTERIYTQGEMIFEENSPSNEIYLILEGEVEILVNPDPFKHTGEEPHRITKHSQGQSFGEVALVDQGLRSAAARCASMRCRLLVIDRKKFMKLLKSDLQMGFTVMQNLAADLCLKIRRTTFAVRESLLYGNPKEQE
jgi:CRP/FNR family transcriptional regulator, cyclic AMP receptor protein